MESSKFFKNIWHFNACVIAISGVPLMIGAFVLFFYIIRDLGKRYDYAPQVIVHTEQEDLEIEETFQIERIIPIPGTALVIVPLDSEQDFSLGYSGRKSVSSTRDLVFIDVANEKSHLLLSHRKYLILNHQFIRTFNKEEVLAIVYLIVKSDTNKDGNLTNKDKKILAISRSDGTRYTEIMTGVDGWIGSQLVDRESIAVLYIKKQVGYTGYINLVDFVLVKEFPFLKLTS